MSDSHAEEAHTGPIKTPSQFLWASIASFVVPVFIVIGLVYFVTSAPKPSTSTRDDAVVYAGSTQQSRDKATAERIQKVGTVEIRDANRTLKNGEDVYKAQCAACHATGAANAPKFGDAAAWGPRIKTGFEALVTSALKGKGAMAAQGGGDFEDVEIARAVAFMANAAGGKFDEPKAPAPAAAASK